MILWKYVRQNPEYEKFHWASYLTSPTNKLQGMEGKKKMEAETYCLKTI